MNSDLFFEILTRTTLETVDTCKVVSKELKELVNDPWFMQNYNQKTRNIFGYFVQTIKGTRHLSTFVSIDPTLKTPNISTLCFEDDSKILASSSQGILCCRKYENKSYQYYVCKPSTSQLVALPSPRKPGQLFERVALVVLKSNPLHYKIIRFSDNHYSPSEHDSYICEIFDSKIWTWRRSKNLLITKHCTVFGHQPSVCIGGVVYWLTNNESVLAFDSATETHTEFPTPTAKAKYDEGYEKKRIVEYKGKLGFSCEYKSEKLLIWELEDRRNCKWKIKKVVRIDKFEKKLIGCSLADMALMSGYKLQVYERSGLCYPMDIFPFRSDWEPVNLEGSEMTRF